MRTFASALGAVLFCGCSSTTLYRGADPVDAGKWQVGAAIGAGVLNDTEQDTRLPTADIELHVRRGVAQDLDLGLKLYTVGVEANATWRVWAGNWSWALAPAVSGVRTPNTALLVDAVHVFSQTAAIATRALSPRWRLSLGPLVGGGLYWPETGGFALGAWLGGFVNAAVRVWQRWHIVPEIGLIRVFAGEVPVRGGVARVGVALVRDM